MSVLRAGYRRVPAIPTRYRGVLMRSRLEARSAAALDRLRIPWVYEPRRFARYLPDFQLFPRGARPWFLEIKPPSVFGDLVGNDLRAALAKMRRIRSVYPSAGLMLWIAKPANRDLGAILVDLPGVVGWSAKPAREVLQQLVRSQRAVAVATPAGRRPWWSILGWK